MAGLVGAGARLRDLGVVQAWVPRARIERALGGSRRRGRSRSATGLGAASSSCSYAAIAIAKSLFQKGASAASALAFQFASTNLVWELGLVLWVLIGWQFTLAEYRRRDRADRADDRAAAAVRLAAPRGARHASTPSAAETGHQHASAGEQLSLRERLTSVSAWSDVAHNFRGDWRCSGRRSRSASCSPGSSACSATTSSTRLFIEHAPAPLRPLENVIVGPIIAVLSFVCSIGNVPLAAVLWSGGISFAGVIAFLFADLIVIPIVADLPQVLRRRASRCGSSR